MHPSTGRRESPQPPRMLAQMLRQLFADVLAANTTLDACVVIGWYAPALVVGADHASICVVKFAGYETVLASSPVAEALDRLQAGFASGPGVDAASTGDAQLSTDLSIDERWPEFGPTAVANHGTRSVLSVQLAAGGQHRAGAVLNLYAGPPDAFDETSRAMAEMLAAAAAVALGATRISERNANLELALQSNRDIGTAIGILMGLHRVTRPAAFTLLREASQRSRRKLRDIALAVIETGSFD